MIYKKLKPASPINRKTVDSWKMRMENIPCFIIGNAPSLFGVNLKPLEDFFTIGINRVFKNVKGHSGIDTTILMWQDMELWYNERRSLDKLKCIKYCTENADPIGNYYHFELMNGGFKLPITPTVLFGRGSTGPLAFELAYILGCNPIILLGYDCKYKDGKTDFYGINVDHKPYTIATCNRGLKWVSNFQHSKTIINCSSKNVFDISSKLEDAVSKVSILYPNIGRKYFINRLFNG
jgi:hypothetical protein